MQGHLAVRNIDQGLAAPIQVQILPSLNRPTGWRALVAGPQDEVGFELLLVAVVDESTPG